MTEDERITRLEARVEHLTNVVRELHGFIAAREHLFNLQSVEPPAPPAPPGQPAETVQRAAEPYRTEFGEFWHFVEFSDILPPLTTRAITRKLQVLFSGRAFEAREWDGQNLRLLTIRVEGGGSELRGLYAALGRPCAAELQTAEPGQVLRVELRNESYEARAVRLRLWGDAVA